MSDEECNDLSILDAHPGSPDNVLGEKEVELLLESSDHEEGELPEDKDPTLPVNGPAQQDDELQDEVHHPKDDKAGDPDTTDPETKEPSTQQDEYIVQDSGKPPAKALGHPPGDEHGISSVYPNLWHLKDSSPINAARNKVAISFFRPKNPVNCGNPLAPPLTIAPPARPHLYGSILFPALELLPQECPSRILSSISTNFWWREFHAFKASRAKRGYPYLYDVRDNNRPFCLSCSEYEFNPKPVFHRHFSTKFARLNAQLDHFGRLPCTQCKNSPHYTITGGRTPILLTSSMMHDHWGKGAGIPFAGDSLHLDCESIPGAKFCNLERAFKSLYSNHPLPVDCVVVCGYNNLLNCKAFKGRNYWVSEDLLQDNVNSAMAEIKDEVRALRRAVLKTGPPHQDNSIGFCTLPVPPCMAWKSNPKSAAGKRANLIRGHQISMLNQLNDFFREVNQECFEANGIDVTRAPSFLSWGTKRKASLAANDLQDQALGPFRHRLSLFRERQAEHKLHFSPYVKIKMARACVRYFRALYQLQESVGESKAEGSAWLEAVKSLPENAWLSGGQVDRGIFTAPGFDRCKPKDISPAIFPLK